ncbi:MAG: hypothetical protein E7638_08455 [Ruminococcaceae bacterium]|nr:hypothetical protein [Oscillospiraceae bacterium]
MPELTLDSLLADEREDTFMSKFEGYTLDQFPLRDGFRTLKSIASYYIFGHLDNNGIYIEDGYAAQLEYPINEGSIDYAAAKFKEASGYFGEDTAFYFAVVPDKGYFLAEENGYPSLDYDRFFTLCREKMDFARQIDITGTLSLENYFKTDTHWKPETLGGTADAIADAMGVTLSADYEEAVLDVPFYGVYYGQSALPLPSEEMRYLTGDVLDGCTVYSYEAGREIGVYDMEKAHGKDPYEMFLGGNLTAVKITNPAASTDRELVVFRDSFGASLTPLLIEAYSEIIVIDIRYAPLSMIAGYRDPGGRPIAADLGTADDVLFIYSTLVLNNSNTLR